MNVEREQASRQLGSSAASFVTTQLTEQPDKTHLVLVTFCSKKLLPTISARKGPPNARNGCRRMKGSRPATLGDWAWPGLGGGGRGELMRAIWTLWKILKERLREGEEWGQGAKRGAIVVVRAGDRVGSAGRAEVPCVRPASCIEHTDTLERRS